MDDVMMAQSGITAGMAGEIHADDYKDYKPNDDDEGMPDDGGLS